MSPDILRRFVLLKQHFRHSSSFLNAGNDESALILLGLQDCIEWFLGLCCEHLHSTPNKAEMVNFSQWWEAADNGLKISGRQQLPYKIQILKVNKARVNLKHHMIMPTTSDLLSHHAHSENFLLEATDLVFGVKIDEISEHMLVQNQAAKDVLITGYGHLTGGKYFDAVCSAALAAAGGKGITQIDISELKYSHSFRLINSDTLFNKLLQSGQDSSLRFHLMDQIDRINTFAEITSLGLEYFEYLKFLHLTPAVISSSGVEKMGLQLNKDPSEYGRSKEEAAFCLSFATKLLIRKQELKRVLKSVM